MGSCAGEALVWVIRRNGSWWPGRILGTDELPENGVLPRPAGTPIKLLGSSDGTIDWYNIEDSKCVKPFRCGEFAECIENAKVRGRLKNIAYKEGKYACRDDAIMHALAIEMSSNEEPTYQTTKCSKEDTSSVHERRKTKMKIISFVTPLSKESEKRNDSSLPELDEGAMECQAPESDAVGLDARVEGTVFEPTEPENNIEVYDAEMSIYGNYTGHALPLAFLISKSTGKPIKGYPVTVEVLQDSCPASSADDHHPAISSFDCLMESRISVPRKARSLRIPICSRKIPEHDLDKSWLPHTQSFTSFHSSPTREERSSRKPVVAEDSTQPICSAVNPTPSSRELQSFTSFHNSPTREERSRTKPVVVEDSMQPICPVINPTPSSRELQSFTSFHNSPTREERSSRKP
ncbi:hypothetical protein EJB05_15942, partial [Eragrostis curvula]